MKSVQKRGKDMEKIKKLMRLLIDEKPLPPQCRDHSLKGSRRSFRDAHIEPGRLLIYKISGDVVRFERTGRHSDVFSE